MKLDLIQVEMEMLTSRYSMIEPLTRPGSLKKVLHLILKHLLIVGVVAEKYVALSHLIWEYKDKMYIFLMQKRVLSKDYL